MLIKILLCLYKVKEVLNQRIDAGYAMNYLLKENKDIMIM